MLHAILVSLASSVIGAFVIVGCVFVLLKIFAPHVFLEDPIRVPKALPAYKLENIFVKDLLVYSMMGSSKSQAMGGRISASVLENALRGYKAKVSALSSLSPDPAIDQTAFFARYHDYLLRDSTQSEQEAPEQQAANSTPEFVQ